MLGEPARQAVLLGEPRFRRFALAKFLQLVAQNALIYGIFIAYIAAQGSSIVTSAFVLASVAPSILLSVPGGIVADALPKKLTLLIVLLLRVAIVWAFIDVSPGLAGVLGLTFVLWSVYQFYTPPENVALLAVVPAGRLAAATSFLLALSLAGQLAGAGLIAPLILKVVGRQGLFYTVEALLLMSLVLFLLLPHLSPAAPRGMARTPWWSALPVGLREIRSRPGLLRITFLRALIDSGMMMVMVAAPAFIQDSLRTGVENAVYIAVPGAVGIGLGLALAPLSMTVLRPGLIVGFGYVCFLMAVCALALVGDVSDELADLTSPLADMASALGLSREILATTLILPLGGFGLSLVQVSSRVEVLRSVPAPLVGQVLSTQSAVGSLVAVIPTLLSGVVLDVLPVQTVLILIAVSLSAAAALTLLPGAARAERVGAEGPGG